MLDYIHIPVEELVPHSPPMVLIDRIIDYNDDKLVAEVDIVISSMFYDETISGVPTWVGIEYMAQTISALAGVRAKTNNAPIKLGFLLGARKYQMPHKIFALGETYQVKIEQLFRDDLGLACFECKIFNNDEIWAASAINVFEADNIKEVIK